MCLFSRPRICSLVGGRFGHAGLVGRPLAQ
jgi:hypothetical protein